MTTFSKKKMRCFIFKSNIYNCGFCQNFPWKAWNCDPTCLDEMATGGKIGLYHYRPHKKTQYAARVPKGRRSQITRCCSQKKVLYVVSINTKRTVSTKQSPLIPRELFHIKHVKLERPSIPSTRESLCWLRRTVPTTTRRLDQTLAIKIVHNNAPKSESGWRRARVLALESQS